MTDPIDPIDPLDPLGILESEFVCNGELITVSTVQNPGESDEDFAKRHKEEVAEAKKDCTESALPTMPLATSWNTESARMTYSSSGADPERHEATVAELKKYFPPKLNA